MKTTRKKTVARKAEVPMTMVNSLEDAEPARLVVGARKTVKPKMATKTVVSNLLINVFVRALTISRLTSPLPPLGREEPERRAKIDWKETSL